MHANGWDCGTDTLYGDCQHLEYGNLFDTMGQGGYSLDFNLFYKEHLGWIPPARILAINASGKYTLSPLEQATGVVGAIIGEESKTAHNSYLLT